MKDVFLTARCLQALQLLEESCLWFRVGLGSWFWAMWHSWWSAPPDVRSSICDRYVNLSFRLLAFLLQQSKVFFRTTLPLLQEPIPSTRQLHNIFWWLLGIRVDRTLELGALVLFSNRYESSVDGLYWCKMYFHGPRLDVSSWGLRWVSVSADFHVCQSYSGTSLKLHPKITINNPFKSTYSGGFIISSEQLGFSITSKITLTGENSQEISLDPVCAQNVCKVLQAHSASE